MLNLKKIIVVSSILSIPAIFTSCTEINYTNIKNENLVKNENSELIDLSINFFGDLLIHNSVYNAAKVNDTYNFTGQFEDIKDIVTDANYTVGNLEVPLAGKDIGYSNYPSFNAPEQILNALKDTLDVELLTTATNHSLDKGYKGLVNTINFTDLSNISHTGTYKDHASSENIHIADINGAKVAILNYTYGTNGIAIPKDKPYSVNILDKDKIKADSVKAKELGANFIIAKLHWGTEYNTNESGYGESLENLDTTSQRGLSKYLFENTDIGLIVGDHPHVVQNIEKMNVTKDGVSKEGTVVYSLGNFISAQKKEFTDTGIIAKLNIQVNTNDINSSKVKTVEYTPVFVDRNTMSSNKNYRVVNINQSILDYENKSDNLISGEEYKKIKKYRDYYRDKLIQEDFVFEK